MMRGPEEGYGDELPDEMSRFSVSDRLGEVRCRLSGCWLAKAGRLIRWMHWAVDTFDLDGSDVCWLWTSRTSLRIRIDA